VTDFFTTLYIKTKSRHLTGIFLDAVEIFYRPNIGQRPVKTG